MNERPAAILFAPTAVDEAKGVTIRRVIGGDRMAILDPFLLLDHASIKAESDVVGFPRHPHRGIETLSYVLTGEVGHKDSIGNESIVGPGGTQWMTAGNGIWHEEMMKPGAEGAEMLQLWFSLPRAQKRIPAAYLGGPADTVPEVEKASGIVRVVAGEFEETKGLFQGIAVDPTVLDVTLHANSTIEIPTELTHATFAYVVRGNATSGDKKIKSPEVVVYGDGDYISITAGPEGARFLFVSAKPLHEPILQYRSLVMNTVDDIGESLAMIEDGTFGKH